MLVAEVCQRQTISMTRMEENTAFLQYYLSIDSNKNHPENNCLPLNISVWSTEPEQGDTMWLVGGSDQKWERGRKYPGTGVLVGTNSGGADQHPWWAPAPVRPLCPGRETAPGEGTEGGPHLQRGDCQECTLLGTKLLPAYKMRGKQRRRLTAAESRDAELRSPAR